MYIYSIKPEYLGTSITLYNIGNCRNCNSRRYTGFNSVIHLTNKTPQEQLEYIYSINHPSVTRRKKVIKETPKLESDEYNN